MLYCLLCCTASLPSSNMSRYIFIVRALRPRDGGWVRLFGQFDRMEDAWKLVILMWDLMVRSGDYTTVDVVRTISFVDFGAHHLI